MDITETLYVASRNAWRSWLSAHHDVKMEIWLVSYRKKTGMPSIPYNDAVEEALCFGWIDSTRKGMDEDRYAQRFSPRRPESGFSQTNKERLARLIAQGRVLPSVVEDLKDFAPDEFEFPDDILSALQANKEAWSFFEKTSLSYQRIRIAYVEAARGRSEEYNKRLNNLIERSAQGKQFGYGIEEYF